MSFVATLIRIKSWRISRLQFFYRSFYVFFFIPILRMILEYLNVLFFWVDGFLTRLFLIRTAFVLSVFIPYVSLLYKRTHDLNQTWNIEVIIFLVTILLNIIAAWFEIDWIFIIKILWMFGSLIVLISHVYLCLKKGDVGDNQHWASLQ